jgi:hypothetical protein
MIHFNNKANHETECYLSREATVTVDGEQHLVNYLIIIRMDQADDTIAKIVEIDVETIPDLDDYTFGHNLSEEEQERRHNKCYHIYKMVGRSSPRQGFLVIIYEEFGGF